MSGELWREIWQVGLESVFATSVAATRKVYVMSPTITRERQPRPKRFATGSRDNQRAHTLGPVTVGGQVKLDVSGAELLEWLTCLFGAATVTTPGGATTARLHTFKPLTTIPSMTIERNDGARLRQVTGVMVDKFSLTGSVEGTNEATFDLFGADYTTWAGPLTSLADRVPSFMEGWQSNVYLDTFGGTPGTTLVANAGINWKVEVGNHLGRKYFAGNTLALGAITTGELDITASVTLEAAASIGPTEIANWEAETNRLLRLEFLGPADGIESGQREFVTIDLPGAWATVNFNGNDQGTRCYEFGLNYVYSTSLAAGIVVRAQSARTAAFA